jgi:azurin
MAQIIQIGVHQSDTVHQIDNVHSGDTMRAFIVTASICVLASLAVPSAQGGRKDPAPAAKAPAGAPRTVDIVGTDDMKFNVTTIAAKAGERLRIRLTSKGTMPKLVMAHNVVVLTAATDALKFVTAGINHRATDFIAPELKSAVVAKTALAGPGEVVDVVFTVPSKPGRYPYVCTFAGHFQAGMKGTLVVK